uniref:Uncharacterized protein n=1 Tax=Romanomermis culicivorax TaxID=13658 RepID=A0A915JTV9_ROMCU
MKFAIVPLISAKLSMPFSTKLRNKSNKCKTMFFAPGTNSPSNCDSMSRHCKRSLVLEYLSQMKNILEAENAKFPRRFAPSQGTAII